ncbi:hypothetical protein R1sor_002422 [Riccia sorocarpa]|uniref:Transposase n=1 Tax=Riccia sorocarpa TaxID=122646 RepID=A0ABD3H274_9MARC
MAREAEARHMEADVIPEVGDVLVDEAIVDNVLDVAEDEEYMAKHSVLQALGIQKRPLEAQDQVPDSQVLGSPVIDSQSPQVPTPEVAEPPQVPRDAEPPQVPATNELPLYGFVALSKLRELFQVFKVCCPHHGCDQQLVEPTVKTIHQTWSLSMRCSRGHRYGWTSTEMELYHSISDITHREYHAALSAGLWYTQLNGMCVEMGLAPISEDHFFAFQLERDHKVG